MRQSHMAQVIMAGLAYGMGNIEVLTSRDAMNRTHVTGLGIDPFSGVLIDDTGDKGQLRRTTPADLERMGAAEAKRERRRLRNLTAASK
jgi:hypothetical protein